MTFSPFKAALVSAVCFFSIPAVAGQSTTAPYQTWNKQVRDQLVQLQAYPARALEAGLEGTVRLQFDVADDGRVTALKVAGSSGQPLLDAGAVRMVAHVSHLPVPGEARSVLVPFTFRLNDADSHKAVKRSPLSHWRDAVRRQVAGKMGYTADLAKAGVEGRVALRLQFDAKGRVIGQDIHQSSGNKLLDAAILRRAGAIGQLPKLPEGLDDDAVILPVVYKLAENR